MEANNHLKSWTHVFSYKTRVSAYVCNMHFLIYRMRDLFIVETWRLLVVVVYYVRALII